MCVAWIRARLKVNSATVFLGPEEETRGHPPCFSLSSSWVSTPAGTFLHCRDTETRTAAVTGPSPRMTEFLSDESEGAEWPPSWHLDKELCWCISGDRKGNWA